MSEEGIQDVRRMFAPAEPDPRSFDTPFGRVVVDPRVPPDEIRLNHWNGPTLLRCAPPEPEVPEAVKDLLVEEGDPLDSTSVNGNNRRVLEAYRRGQRSK